MMSLASSVTSPAVVAVTAIVDLERGQYGVGQATLGADLIALISTLRFLDPALAMVLTATRF